MCVRGKKMFVLISLAQATELSCNSLDSKPLKKGPGIPCLHAHAWNQYNLSLPQV